MQDYAKKKKVLTSKLNLKCIKTLSGHFAKIYTICWSTKSKILSASQDGKMIVFWIFSVENDGKIAFFVE